MSAVTPAGGGRGEVRRPERSGLPSGPSAALVVPVLVVLVLVVLVLVVPVLVVLVLAVAVLRWPGWWWPGWWCSRSPRGRGMRHDRVR